MDIVPCCPIDHPLGDEKGIASVLASNETQQIENIRMLKLGPNIHLRVEQLHAYLRVSSGMDLE